MSNRFTLNDLIALNDEVVALSRAGVPLGRGLLGFGGDVPGKLGRVARGLGKELDAGMPLEGALVRMGSAMPATYRAVVEAGMRTGRLSAALEDVADYARGYSELRRSIGQALVYPLMVLLFGYVLFLGYLVLFMPRLRAAFESLGVGGSGVARWLERLGDSVPYWGPLVPLVVVCGVAAWLWMGRARGLDAARGLRWVPWLASTMADWRAANFAGWLGLLSRHGVPLAEALRLSGDACGDKRLEAWAVRAANEEERGRALADSQERSANTPALLHWLLVLGLREGKLDTVLAHASGLYKQRAWRKAELLRLTMPTMLLVCVAGISALVYLLTVVLPWTQLLSSLGREIG